MPRKTPKLLLYAIENHNCAVELVEDLIRAKTTRPVDMQAPHVRAGTPELWIARLEGQAIMLESLLHHAGCYAGFAYLSEPEPCGEGPGGTTYVRVHIGPTHPQYADWRRRYFTRT